MKIRISILAALFAAAAQAANVVAVLEIIATGEVDLKISEFRYLTDELRNNARTTLPQNRFTILTRDNILQLMPPDEKEAECLNESCAVDIGRAIGAEYITQGYVGKFGDMLTLTVELYETMSGNLLGSFLTESKEVMGLLATIREKAPALFANIKESGEVKKQEFNNNSQLSTLNSQLPKKSNTSSIIAVSLDIIGAAAIAFGIYQHITATNLYNDYKDMPSGHENNYYEPTREKAKDAKFKGNVGYIVGGALLASGIAIHIWF